VKAGYVSLVGRPNSGKSTLLNRIIGAKISIVSDKPQTTRTRILGVKNYSAAQVVFVDTPGIHRPLHRMNVRMVDTALETMGTADLVTAVVDASERPGGGDRYVLDLLGRLSAPVVLVLNKIDLIRRSRLLPLIDEYRKARDFPEIVPVSALTGDGVDRLERVLLALLPEGQPLYPEDYLTDQPERFLAAEIVREKLLQHVRDEIPFSTAVAVDRFEEPQGERGILRIFCTIVVEQESQKPIVIGRGGQMLKCIGTEARADLESFFGTHVFLDLHVRVRADWRENERLLDELGVPRGRR
jgi:GTP-binding protein Era